MSFLIYLLDCSKLGIKLKVLLIILKWYRRTFNVHLISQINLGSKIFSFLQRNQSVSIFCTRENPVLPDTEVYLFLFNFDSNWIYSANFGGSWRSVSRSVDRSVGRLVCPPVRPSVSPSVSWSISWLVAPLVDVSVCWSSVSQSVGWSLSPSVRWSVVGWVGRYLGRWEGWWVGGWVGGWVVH